MSDISEKVESRVSDLPQADGYDLVVIGAGSAGLSVAAAASQLGASVALIEADRMGGECLNIGCVPSKALLRCAHVAQTVREAGRFGVRTSEPVVDGDGVHAYVHSRIAAIAPHDSAERFRSLGCHVFFGKAHFLDAKSIEVKGNETLRITGRRFVVAVGSSPKVPTIRGLSDVGFRTNNDVFDLRSIPRRVTVVGGGPIGMEMAQAFANLGSKVVVVQSRDRILPRDDAELALRLQSMLERQGIRILKNAKTTASERRGGEKVLWIEHSTGTEDIASDEILVATGRRPNTAMNLEAAGVEFDDHGIKVNRKMQTSARHIFACGDVVGPHRFTHMAGYQAGVVVANALFRFPKKVRDHAIPWCTFTDPELAHVGMTNADADAKGAACSTITFDLAKCDRAVCDSAEGLVKIVLDGRDRLLGAQILAPRAGEMIHEFALLISSGTKLSALRDTIHCYPTYSDAVRQAVSEVYRPHLFSDRTRTVVKWIKRIFG